MFEQPPEDLGTVQVLLVVALVLLVIGVIVLVYEYNRPPAAQLALDRLQTSTCVRELASGVSSPGCPAPLSQAQASRRQ
jgi:DMSO reductase anchor subunit